MRSAHALLFTLAVSLSSLATAANVDPVYYPDQGKVVLPNLKVNGQVYYVILKQIPNTYDFRLDMTSISNLSLPLTFTPATAADLVGTFTTTDDPSSSATFRADGTYTMIQGANVDSSCPNGGSESGIWQYEPATGVFNTVATTDNNGVDCGLSSQKSVVKIKKSGTDLYFLATEKGQAVERKLVRKTGL